VEGVNFSLICAVIFRAMKSVSVDEGGRVLRLRVGI